MHPRPVTRARQSNAESLHLFRTFTHNSAVLHNPVLPDELRAERLLFKMDVQRAGLGFAKIAERV
jgi:hypothetical protein